MAQINETKSWTKDAVDQKELAYKKFYVEYNNHFGIDSKMLSDIAKNSSSREYDLIFNEVSYAMTLCRYIYNTLCSDIPEKENERCFVSENRNITIKKAHPARHGVKEGKIYEIEKESDIDAYIQIINSLVLNAGFKQVRSKTDDSVFRIRGTEIFYEDDGRNDNPLYRYDPKTELLTFLKHAVVLDIYSSDSFEYFMNNTFMLSRLNDSFDTWLFKKMTDEILKKKDRLTFDEKRALLDTIASLKPKSNQIASSIRKSKDMRIHVKNDEENHMIDEEIIGTILEEDFKTLTVSEDTSVTKDDLNNHIRDYISERSSRRNKEHAFVSTFKDAIRDLYGDVYLDHIKKGTRSIERDLVICVTLQKSTKNGISFNFKDEYIPIFAEDWITDCNEQLKNLEYKELNFKRPFELLSLVSLLKNPNRPLEYMNNLIGGLRK